MNSVDYDYFRGRSLEEDQAARKARCIEARICHQQLADAYRQRCGEVLSKNAALASCVPGASAEIRRPSEPGLRTAFGFAPRAANHKEKFQLAAS